MCCLTMLINGLKRPRIFNYKPLSPYQSTTLVLFGCKPSLRLLFFGFAFRVWNSRHILVRRACAHTLRLRLHSVGIYNDQHQRPSSGLVPNAALVPLSWPSAFDYCSLPFGQRNKEFLKHPDGHPVASSQRIGLRPHS